MGYSSNFTRKNGAVADSANDPMTWNLSADRDKAALVFNAISNQADTFHIRMAATEAELTSAVEGTLYHDNTVTMVANTDKPIVVAFNPALPYGKAWLTGTGTHYILSGAARAHS
ncbi:MAG: hypothetical protein E6R03_05120 [Hyphomicrobiaceae bacterium]|nr:MAG: hypothetical protein E6R03_05120 [Hyphomicrobiaceae bacterium]